jgi:MoaA/NifB/PqqE/SkfB family radical SAM enzyme
MTHGLVAKPGIRVRSEYFGALAWTTNPRKFYRLDHSAALALILHSVPRPPDAARPAGLPGITDDAWRSAVAGLREQGILEPGTARAAAITAGDIEAAREMTRAHTARGQVLRPFWVHIQPFTRCNQTCIHCYCHGGPKADPFLLPLSAWQGIIGLLDDYGVLDVYVTGGESLLYDDFFAIAEDILSRGMGFGVSTNATVLPDRALARLRGLQIETVQVSLDGARASVHERIRGAPGSFARTCDGIRRIAQFSDPVINTVVNRINRDELEDIVRLGKSHGCGRFKFFPQKPVGRGSSVELTLTDKEITDQLVPECARLAAELGVEIETVDPARPCGSGSIGFALDQNADIYPCIFGVADLSQRCGNILTDPLDEVWFGSPVLARFRHEVTTPCRRCEQ